MSDDEKEFLEVLRGEFFGEASEALDNCESVILAYENSTDPEQITELKRLLHSIKGSSRAVDLMDLSETLHVFESRCELEVQNSNPSEFVKVSLKCVDGIRNYLESVQEGNESGASGILSSINSAIGSN